MQTNTTQNPISLLAYLKFMPALFLLLSCVACAEPQPIPVSYAPSSTLAGSGSLTVKEFKYLPHTTMPGGKPIAENQIRNTAMGNIIIDKNVSTFVRDAIFLELRFVGIKTDGNDRILSGDIEDFLIDDLGYSVDWSLNVRYQVNDANGKVLYTSKKTINRKTNKFINVFASLNEIIKLNVEELIKDPEFLKSIN